MQNVISCSPNIRVVVNFREKSILAKTARHHVVMDKNDKSIFRTLMFLCNRMVLKNPRKRILRKLGYFMMLFHGTLFLAKFEVVYL